MTTTIAAFDFDNTITTRDTLLPFLLSVTSPYKKMLNSAKLLPTAIRYKIGLLENHAAKEKVLITFLQNYAYELLLTHAQHFAATVLPAFVRPEALQRIRWHQQQKHHCMIISAGLEIYLLPWAKALGFADNDVIATRIDVTAEGSISGKIAGRNCFGPEKVNRLLEIAGAKENFTLFAYGDSRGDRELLALADHAFYRQMPT